MHRTALFIQLCFNHGTSCPFVRVRLQFLYFGYEQDHLQQFIQADALFGRDIDEDIIAAPFFRDDVRIRSIPA